MRTKLASLCLAGLGCFMCVTQSFANPNGGAVVGGGANATITGQGTALTTINQNAPRAIINWQDFSIASGEVTRFLQPSASAATLNRVLGGNPSEIYGSLLANGRVFVINRNGILVGPGGQVDTKGFLASTHDVPNASFLSGANLTFSGSSTAPVRNEGTIRALGGDVFLIGHTVENAGSIHAPGGAVGLAAGSQVRLMQAGAERITVLAGNAAVPADKGVNNVGVVEAAAAELKAAGGNIYALAINNGGVVRATTIVKEGGRIMLKAAGGNIENSGTLTANGTHHGGTVIVDAGHNAATPATTVSTGTIEARGAAGKGGAARLLGDHVGLTGNALVDVSGGAAGGTALIGGDFQGRNPAVQNARRTYVGPDAEIRADALTLGNGGRVVVWSDEVTRFHGTVYARGGANGGDGGFVEVSSKGSLGFDGRADTTAAHGKPGSLLLDPKNVTIATNGTAAVGDVDLFADSPTLSLTITPNAIEMANDVTIQAINDITVTHAINKIGNGDDLILQAGRSITVNANISVNGVIRLTANDSSVPLADQANRDAGPGNITMMSGTTIHASGNDNMFLTIDSSTTSPFTPGSMTLANLSAAGDRITITGGAAAQSVSQLSGGALSATELLLLGSGSFQLGQSGNDVTTLAANVTGSLTYQDADNLVVGTVGATDGLTSGGNAISVSTVNGDLTVNNTGAATDVDAGAGTASLAAGSTTGNDKLLDIKDNAVVKGLGGVTLTGDAIAIGAGASVNAGTAKAILKPSEAGTAIDLGGSSGAGTLGLSDGELDLVTAGVLQIGNADNAAGALSGSITVTDNITPALATTLSLQTGAGTGNIGQDAGKTITVANLAIRASGNVNLPEANAVTTLAALLSGTDKNFTYVDASAIALGAVDSLSGVVNNNGDVSVTAGNNFSITGGTLSGEIVNVNVSGTGKIGVSGADPLFVHAPTKVNATTANQDIFLKDTGDLKVGAVNSGTANTSIEAAGSILDDGDNATVIRANGLTLTAGNSIGGPAANAEIDTDVTTLTSASAANGSINLVEKDTASANGLAVTSATAAGAGNDVSIGTAAGDLTVVSVSAPDAVSLTATAGAIKDDADDNTRIVGSSVSLTAGTSIGAAGAPNDVDTDTTSLTVNIKDNLFVRNASGPNPADLKDLATLDITSQQMGKANTYSVQALNLTFNVTDAGTSYLITDVTDTTGLNFRLKGDEKFTVGKIDVGSGSATLESGAAIEDDLNNATTIKAASASLIAGGGIGGGAATEEIDTDVGSLSANSSSANGNQFITEADGITALSLNAGSGNVTLIAGGAVLDSDVGTDIKGTVANVTAPSFGASGAGNAIQTEVADLTVNTSAANGNQFINEANGLTALNLNAGSGNVTLTAAGAVQDTDANTDIKATAASITAASVGTAASFIQTDVADLTVDTSAANGNQFLSEFDGLTALNLNAGSGNITLNAGGAVQDSDAATDLKGTAANVTLTAAGDFGSSANKIGTDVADLAVDTTAANGNQFISEASGLTGLNLNAGSGNVTLDADGAVQDADGATDIRATAATVTAASVGASGPGNAVQTFVADLTVNTATANGNQFLSEFDGLTALNLNAGNGNVTLTAGGGVHDSDAATDIKATAAAVTTTTAGDIGLAVNPIQTDVADLSADTAANNGNQFFDEVNSLTALDLKAGAGAVTLTVGGAVSDSDAATDVAADSLAITAQTGISSLQTSVKKLEAETVSGGISLTNSGAGELSIGGVSAALSGVRVTGANGGGIRLVNDATLSIKLTGERVVAPGDVLVQANGATADVVTGGMDGYPLGAIQSTAGSATVRAGQDILLGAAGVMNWGNVEGGGGVVLSAGRDVVVDQFSRVDAHGAGTVDITAGRDVNLVNYAGITSEGGAITITTGAGRTFSLAAGFPGINTHQFAGSGGDIVINADDMDISSALNAGIGAVTLRNVTAGREIDLGSTTPGKLSLDASELNRVTATALRIGRNDARASGNLTVTAPVTSPVGILHLLTGGAVVDGNAAAGADITGSQLAIEAATGIGTAADPLETAANTLAAANTASGDIEIRNAGALTIGVVDGVTGVSSAGNVRIVAGSPLTVSTNVSGAGDVTLQAGNSAAAGDKLTISADVKSTGGGTVSLIAGDDIEQTAGKIQSTGGAANLVKLTADNEGAGVADGDRGGITQSGGSIETGSLVFRSSENILANSALNDAQNVAASLTGSGANMEYRDATALTVSTVDGVNGISTTDGDVLLDAGSVALNQGISAGAGTVRIVSAGTVNATTPNGTVMAAALGVRAGDDVTLNQNNDVDTFAAANSGSGKRVEFKDADDVTAGSVGASGPFVAVNGIQTTGNGDVLLDAGSVTINQNINAGGGTVRIVSGGIVNENAASGTVTAGALGVRAAGDVTLNQNNDVDTFAASVSGAGKKVEFKDSDDATVGAVGANGSFGATTGIATSDGDVLLDTGGKLTINQDIAAGNGTVRVKSAAGVEETGSGKITAAALGVIAADDVTLNNNNDVHTIAAANSGGGKKVEFKDADDLSVGSVSGSGSFGAIAGIQTASNGDALLDAGSLAISQAIAAGGGTVRIVSAGAVNENAASGTVTAGALGVRAGGNVTLNQNNDVDVFAAANSGAGSTVELMDVDDVTIGGVGGSGSFANTVGITTAGGNVRVAANDMDIQQDVSVGGARVTLIPFTTANGITLGSPVGGTLNLSDPELDHVSAGVLQLGQAGGGAITINDAIAPSQLSTLALVSGGNVAETGAGALSVNNLAVSSAASVTLEGANQVGTVGVSANGPVSISDASDLTVDMVDGVSGIVGVGPATLRADDMEIMKPVTGGGADVTLENLSNDREVVLGDDAGGRLRLKQAELDQITAGTLRIGGPTAGHISIKEAISLTTVNTLVLQNARTLTESGAGSLAVNQLALKSVGDVTMRGGNDVNTLAAMLAGNGRDLAFNDVDDLSIGSAGGVNGVSTLGGEVELTAPTLNVNSPISTVSGADSADVTLKADTMNIAQAVNAGTHRAIISGLTLNRAVELGTEVAGRLSLTDAETDLVTAGVLQIGEDATTGNINVSAEVSPAGTTTLSLRTANTISEDINLGRIIVADICLHTPGPPAPGVFKANLNGRNNWTRLTATGGAVQVLDVDDVDIGQKAQITVDDCTSPLPAGSIVKLFGGTATIQVAANSFAALAAVDIPVPKPDTASFGGSDMSAEDAAKILPSGSIGTLWLQVVPLSKPEEKRNYKVEDASKWVSGRVAAFGSTAGPQTAR